MSNQLESSDPEVFGIVKAEETRQQSKLSLIPSENFFSPAVREAIGSVFSHKYSEGNIGARYYGGNEFVDEVEGLAIQRARELFELPTDWDVNVQAVSGSNANLAVYLAMLDVGDTIMGMYLPDGGHLSHGWSYEPKVQQDPKELAYLGGSRKVNITSRMFKVVQYKTSPKTQQFDYDEIAKIARQHKPKLLITGGTAYPQDIDYRRMKQIADEVGALYLADIAHEAGLVAAGVLSSPVGIADIVTMTVQKTLRAGRGAIILARDELMPKINRAIMPGLQGNPHDHIIAGICVGLGEALRPEFKEYQQQVLANAQALVEALQQQSFTLVSGGTAKHLLLIDLTDKPLLGKKFTRALDAAGVIVNFNTMPQETRGPADPSAVRLGTPWVTTRGMREEHMSLIAGWISRVMEVAAPWAELSYEEFEEQVVASTELQVIAAEVASLSAQFPLPVRAELATEAR